MFGRLDFAGKRLAIAPHPSGLNRHSPADMSKNAHYAGLFRQHRVQVEAEALRRLAHEIELSDRLLAIVRAAEEPLCFYLLRR